MPRLVGFQDWRFVSPEEFEKMRDPTSGKLVPQTPQDWQRVVDASGIRIPVPGLSRRLDELASGKRRAPKLTRHGVRDLNGPRMDGWDHNGRAATCPHYRDPEYPTRRQDLTATVRGEVRIVNAYYCIACGEQRFTDADADD